jgi:cell shape-determining protein MreD
MNFDFHFYSPIGLRLCLIALISAFIAKILERVCQENLFGIFMTRVGVDNEYSFDRYVAEPYNIAQ